MLAPRTRHLAVLVLPVLLVGCGKDDPVQPSPPKVHRIAFQSDRGGSPQIFVMNPDGTSVSQASLTPGYATGPQWDSRGTKILFTGFPPSGPGADIYTVAPDGSGQKNLTNSPGVADFQGSWAPSGAEITFTTDRDGNSEIYSMSADGASPTRLTTNPSTDEEPLWSPKGDRIAFVSARDGNREIYVMNVDGSDQTRLTQSVADERDVAWSPTGDFLAFDRDSAGVVQVYSIGASGSGEVQLSNDPYGTAYPSWSPDGSRIAYAASDGLHIVNRDGTHDSRIPNTESLDALTAWSPDGSQIAFVNLDNGKFEIFVIGTSGADRRNLSQNPADDLGPRWEP